MNAVLLAVLVASFTAVPAASPDPQAAGPRGAASPPGLDLGRPLDGLRLRSACDSRLSTPALGPPSLVGSGEFGGGLFGAREPMLRPLGFLRGPRDGSASVWWWSPCVMNAGPRR